MESAAAWKRRRATRADYDYAKRVHHLAYRTVVEAQFGHWDEHEQTAFFDSAWLQHDHEMIEVDGEACGYLAVEIGDDAVRLRELVLHPEYQRRGIGTQVLSDVIGAARERALPVELQVLHRNRALVLYQRLGFEQYETTSTHRLLRLTP